MSKLWHWRDCLDWICFDQQCSLSSILNHADQSHSIRSSYYHLNVSTLSSAITSSMSCISSFLACPPLHLTWWFIYHDGQHSHKLVLMIMPVTRLRSDISFVSLHCLHFASSFELWLTLVKSSKYTVSTLNRRLWLPNCPDFRLVDERRPRGFSLFRVSVEVFG